MVSNADTIIERRRDDLAHDFNKESFIDARTIRGGFLGLVGSETEYICLGAGP